MTEFKNRNFIREKFRPGSYAEDMIHFRLLAETETGLPMYILIDEVRANRSSRHGFRIKVNGNYQELGDRETFVDVDMKGNIYTISDENEKRYSIKDEDFQALMNFMHNNEYTLRKIANCEASYSVMGCYMIKGGEIATEEQKAKLKEITDYLLFSSGHFDEYVETHEDLLW